MLLTCLLRFQSTTHQREVILWMYQLATRADWGYLWNRSTRSIRKTGDTLRRLWLLVGRKGGSWGRFSTGWSIPTGSRLAGSVLGHQWRSDHIGWRLEREREREREREWHCVKIKLLIYTMYILWNFLGKKLTHKQKNNLTKMACYLPRGSSRQEGGGELGRNKSNKHHNFGVLNFCAEHGRSVLMAIHYIYSSTSTKVAISQSVESHGSSFRTIVVWFWVIREPEQQWTWANCGRDLG